MPPDALTGRADQRSGIEVNDVQSQLNPTRVNRIVKPQSLGAIQAALHGAQRESRAVSVAGGRHSVLVDAAGKGDWARTAVLAGVGA